MVGTIDALNSVQAAPAAAPGRAPTAPVDSPDLRDTQAGVQTPQKTAVAVDGSEKQLEEVINERLAKLLRSNVRMRIEIDKGTGDFVYKSIDKKTGEVDRQWPAESVLRMLAFFRELDGLVFDKKA